MSPKTACQLCQPSRIRVLPIHFLFVQCGLSLILQHLCFGSLEQILQASAVQRGTQGCVHLDPGPRQKKLKCTGWWREGEVTIQNWVSWLTLDTLREVEVSQHSAETQPLGCKLTSYSFGMFQLFSFESFLGVGRGGEATQTQTYLNHPISSLVTLNYGLFIPTNS